MTIALTPAGLASLPDPPKDGDGMRVPAHIAMVLQIAEILAEYGRHLLDTIEHRALWRGFATIAQFFGTATVVAMLPRIHLGIMRAVALERMLLMRAGSGRDLKILAPRTYEKRPAKSEAQPAPEGQIPPEFEVPIPPETSVVFTADQGAAGPQAAKAAPLDRRTGTNEPLTLDNLPPMKQIEAEVRRRPVGQTVVDICRDLGVSPRLCSGPFWNQIFMAIHWYRGSFRNIMLEMRRREKQLDKDTWRYPKLGLPEDSVDGIRKVLGFLIGEQPIDPFRPKPVGENLTQPPSPDAPAAGDLTQRSSPDAPAAGVSTQRSSPDSPAAGVSTQRSPPDAPVAAAATGPP